MTVTTTADLENALDEIRRAPQDTGTIEMIVSRPAEDARRVVEEGELSLEEGLVGDNWLARSGGGIPPTYNQVTVMSARYIDLIAGDRDRWQLAGDQIFVDFDISMDNLPAGSRVRLGEAVIEVSAEPHTGCSKFSRRFGVDALRFANSATGKQLRLRGLNAKVVEPGSLRVGDVVAKL